MGEACPSPSKAKSGTQDGLKWKTMVRWHLTDQHDIRALDGKELFGGPVVEDACRRREIKALFNKYRWKVEEQDALGRKEE